MQAGHKQAAFALIDRAVAVLAGLLVVFSLTRLLGAEQYGIFILAETIHILLVLAIEQAPGQSFIFLSANRQEDDYIAVLRSALIVKTIIFFLFYSLIFLLADPIATLFAETSIAPLLRLLPIASLGLIMLGTANQVNIGRQNLLQVAKNDSMMFACLAIVFLVGWLGGFITTPFRGMTVLVIGRFLAGVLAVRSIRREIHRVFNNIKAPEILASLRYSTLSFANSLGVFVYTKTDIIFLGIMSTKTSVGIYGACVAALAYYRMIADAMNMLVFPRISARRELSSQELSRNVWRLYFYGAGIGVTLALPASLAIFFYSESLLTLVYSQAFSAGAPILIMFGAWGMLLPFYRLAGSVLNGLGYPQDNAKTTLAVGAVNVVLNLPLIYFFDAFGAVVASMISSVMGLVLLIRKVRRRLDYS